MHNICAGQGYSIQDILDKLLLLSKKRIRIHPDPGRFRSDDIKVLLGDPTKIRQRTGWQVEIPIDQTLFDLLNYWRERVAADDAVSLVEKRTHESSTT